MGSATWIFGGTAPSDETINSTDSFIAPEDVANADTPSAPLALTPSDRELAARALCRFRKLPETVLLDGRPLWQAYLPEADAVLEALRRK